MRDLLASILRLIADYLSPVEAHEEATTPIAWVPDQNSSSGLYDGPAYTTNPLDASCTCMQPWNSVLPPPPCPLHGPVSHLTVSCGPVR